MDTNIKKEELHKIVADIPNIGVYPLEYVMEHMKLKQKEGTLWLEFGVASGKTINYISGFCDGLVYGFDSFEGLPETWREGFEKGVFNMDGVMPEVNENVRLVKGWFNETLPGFLKDVVGVGSGEDVKKISFLHIDCDLYSSTAYILNMLKGVLDKDCVVVFDELVNYTGYDGETGELRALAEFLRDNDVQYSWIGMNGVPVGMLGYEHENVAMVIHSIGGEAKKV